MPDNIETVNITPNYAKVHAGFLRDADSYGVALVNDFSFDALHKWLGPITIALSAATTTEEVVEVREHLNRLLVRVSDETRKRDETGNVHADWHVSVAPKKDNASHHITVSKGRLIFSSSTDIFRTRRHIEEALDAMCEEAGEAEDVCANCGEDFDVVFTGTPRKCLDCGEEETR